MTTQLEQDFLNAAKNLYDAGYTKGQIHDLYIKSVPRDSYAERSLQVALRNIEVAVQIMMGKKHKDIIESLGIKKSMVSQNANEGRRLLINARSWFGYRSDICLECKNNENLLKWILLAENLKKNLAEGTLKLSDLNRA